MNKYTAAKCIVGTYVRYIKDSGIDHQDISNDKHKIYKVDNISLPEKKEKSKKIIYGLREINTGNMRFITKTKLKKHFMLDTTANLLFEK